MAKLGSAQVFRAGRTARSWNHENDKVDLDSRDDSLELLFSLSSKGGGVTEVRVTIGGDDFGTLARGMAQANRSHALHAMAVALANELEKQAEFETAAIRKGRESVLEEAQRAYAEASAGHDHAERLTRDVVEQMIEKLNESDVMEASNVA
jgi:hypothetical protein